MNFQATITVYTLDVGATRADLLALIVALSLIMPSLLFTGHLPYTVLRILMSKNMWLHC